MIGKEGPSLPQSWNDSQASRVLGSPGELAGNADPWALPEIQCGGLRNQNFKNFSLGNNSILAEILQD